MFRLPLEKILEGATPAKTVYAITVEGEAIPLIFERVFSRGIVPAGEYTPTGPQFGDETDELVSSNERATAQYRATVLPVANTAFLSHDPEDRRRVYRFTEITDGSLKTRVERRLRRPEQHGLSFGPATTQACRNKPTVRTFRVQGPAETIVYYESNCTDWGGDGVYGARWVALYKEDGASLQPLFATYRSSKILEGGTADRPWLDYQDFIRMQTDFVADLNGNGQIEFLLDREGGVSGDTYLAEFSKGGFKRIQKVQVNEEGEQSFTQTADRFLTCEPRSGLN